MSERGRPLREMPRVASWLYRCALRALPEWFATAHGDAMSESFAAGYSEVRRERGRLGALAWALRDALDVLRCARQMRVRERRSTERERAGKRGAMRMIWTDVRHGVRLWLKTPGFTLLAVVTLAIGIGSTTAMFTVVDRVLLRPLPYREGDRLVTVSQTLAEFGRVSFSYPNFVDLREARSMAGLDDVAAYGWMQQATAVLNGMPESLNIIPIGGNLLSLLGIAPMIGRGIDEGDVDSRSERVALLSHGFWRTRFGGDPDVLNGTIRLNGESHQVIGVMPPRFAFPAAGADLWIPLVDAVGIGMTSRIPIAAMERDTRFLRVIGRLAPGVTVDAADAGVSAVMARLIEAYPEANAGSGARVDRTRDLVVGDVDTVLYVLLGAVSLLLVLGCVNIANLMLARSTTRRREVALRSALGAGRARITSQLMAENLVLAVAGGVSGALLAWAGTDLLVALAPETLPRRTEIALDARVLVFTAAVTLVSAFLFGVLPALRASNRTPGDALRDGGRGTVRPGRHRLLRGLVVTQLAIALVLLVGSGLLLRSLARLLAVDPGFEPEHVLTLRLSPATERYPTHESRAALYDAVLERVRALPGVEAASATWALPFSADWASGRITVEGRPLPEGSEPVVGILPVRGDYFGTLRTPVIAGRDFTSDDNDTTAHVAIVNETAARTLFDGTPVGKRYKHGGAEDDEPWITVVGVVADSKRFNLEDDTEPEAYRPHESARWARDLTIVLRTTTDPLAHARPIRNIVRSLDPGLAVNRVAVLDDLIRRSVAEPRFRTRLLTAFATIAFALAIIGVYGILAFVVAGRTQEIGVRMALGANGSRVLSDVLREGGALIGIGLAVGLLIAAIASRTLESLLFQLDTLDALTYIAMAAALALAGLLACFVPARRASRTRPMDALREG